MSEPATDPADRMRCFDFTEVTIVITHGNIRPIVNS